MNSSPFDLDALRRNVAFFGSQRVGRAAVGRAWITASQLQDAVAEAEAASPRKSIEDVLISKGWVTPDQVEQLRAEARVRELDEITRDRPERMPIEAADAADRPECRFGRYILVEEIGRGGMAVVHRAWQTDLERWVAVKVLKQLDALVQRRFEQEARITAGLQHPHLLPIYEFGLEKNEPFIAMAYAGGGSLAGHKFEPRRAAALVADVADAVAEAHRHGVIHRDIKPSNLLVDDHGTVFLGDFGLARGTDLAADQTRAGAILGTLAFAPPEQIAGEVDRVGPRSDVYGLGATLYALVCGKAPFDTASSQVEMIHRAMAEDPPPLRQVADAVPADLEIICAKAMSKEAPMRYESAAALSADLRRYLAGEPILAHAPSFIYRATKWVARRGVAVSAVVAMAIAGIAVAVLARSNTKKDAELRAQERALRISGAYYELSLRTKNEMKVLEASGLGSADGGLQLKSGLDKLLIAIDAAVAAAEQRYPDVRVPRAWSGLARCFAGNPEEGLALIESARLDADGDPFPDAFLARAWLVSGLKSLKRPKTMVGETSFTMEEATEPEGLRIASAKAGEALERAASSPVWSRLEQGREVAAYLAAARQFCERDYEGAAASLEKLFDDAMLSYEARTLAGFAHYLGKRFTKAADAWEGLGTPNGWREAAFACFAAIPSQAKDVAAAVAIADRSIRLYDRTLEAVPSWGPVFFERGQARMYRGMFEERRGDPVEDYRRAIADLTEALRLLPTPTWKAEAHNGRAYAWYLLGYAFTRKQQDALPCASQAIADFDEAMRIEPRDYFARLRANAYRLKGLAEYQKNLDPRDSFRTAVAEHDRLIAAKTSNEVNDWYDRAKALKSWGETDAMQGRDPREAYDRARESYLKSLEIHPGDPAALAERGRVTFKKCEWIVKSGQGPAAAKADLEDAITDLTKAIASGATDEENWTARGRAALIRGVAEEMQGKMADAAAWYGRALPDFEESVRRLPRNPLVHYNLGAIFERLQKWAEAEKAYEKVLELDPANVAAKVHLGAVRKRSATGPDEY